MEILNQLKRNRFKLANETIYLVVFQQLLHMLFNQIKNIPQTFNRIF